MKSDKTNEYMLNLIDYVRREPDLWSTTSLSYGNPQMDQISWDSVTRKLQVLYETNQITVDNVKKSWNNIKESYIESKLRSSAYIFPPCHQLDFLREYTNSGISFDGLFSRKHGRFLVFLQIILNILFFILQIHSAQDILAINSEICFFQFREFLLHIVVAGTVSILYLVRPFSVDYERVSKTALPIVAAISTTSIVSSYLLSFDACTKPSTVDSVVRELSIIAPLYIFNQILIILFHSAKLHCPPTVHELSTILIIQFNIAALSLGQLNNTLRTYFFLVNFGWGFSNFLILVIYYVICHKYSKELYKFQKRRRLLAVASTEEPYVIRFERDE